MTSIVDKSGETIAYLHQNMILDIKQEKLVGLILGNCVFGIQQAPVGKFFNDTFRKKNGKIIAKLGKEISSKKVAKEVQLSQEAWQMLTKVKDHVCMWIDEKKSWTKQDFIEYLSDDKDVATDD
jgi:hypothetical protein